MVVKQVFQQVPSNHFFIQFFGIIVIAIKTRKHSSRMHTAHLHKSYYFSTHQMIAPGEGSSSEQLEYVSYLGYQMSLVGDQGSGGLCRGGNLWLVGGKGRPVV